jgi:hypothetical protein
MADRAFNYEYPGGLDWVPGGKLHQDTLSKLIRYAQDAASNIQERYNSWREMDKKLQAYIQIDKKEREVIKNDPRKPVSIVFPYTYAILETLVSYLVAAFTPEPIFRYEGVSPEDVAGATLMEKVISLQCNKSKVVLNLHTFFRDCSAYGLGIVAPQWIIKRGKRVRSVRDGIYDGSGQFRETRKYKRTESTVLFEGNALDNIDPYCYLPDPNVPIHEPQRGEFVAWMDSDAYVNLLCDEEVDGDLFNVKYLKDVSSKSTSIFGETSRSQTRRRDNWTRQFTNTALLEPIDLLNIIVKLIPKEWDLGDSTYPEKWLFMVAADKVICKAKPLELNHDMFPVAVAAPEFDGYSPVAFSRLEILSGMQTVVDWMFNSHVTNVRKAINDLIIVDPYLLNLPDLENSEAGGIIRLRRPAWGRGVENAAMQLNVVDITRNNVADVGFVIDFMRQIAGTDNPFMGNLRGGGPERLTAKEFQGTAAGAINRLERIAKVVGVQAMQDIGYMFAMHLQQFMSEDVYVKTAGEWPSKVLQNFAVKEGRVKVSPYDVLVDYDLIIRDGSIPGGAFSDAWIQLFQIISQNPFLLQRFDVVRLFKYIATNLGAKNVDDFELSMEARPDAEVEQAVQNGSLQPLSSEVTMNGAIPGGLA